MINLLRLNLGIYEYDIEYFGGTVEYTGNVIAKNRRSCLEEAILTINGCSCTALMERFRHGNAALVEFTHNGIPVRNSLREKCPEAGWFMNAYTDEAEKDDRYLEYLFIRHIKQYGTFFLQVINVVMILRGMYLVLTNSCLSFRSGILVLCSLALFLFFGSLYKYYRVVLPSEYRPWLFTHDNE